jgi:hypothetical protein
MEIRRKKHVWCEQTKNFLSPSLEVIYDSPFVPIARAVTHFLSLSAVVIWAVDSQSILAHLDL